MRYVFALSILFLIIAHSCFAQQEATTITAKDGTIISGVVLDNYPPVYAIIKGADNQERIVDYPALTTVSADMLAAIPPVRYGPNAMPEIPDVSTNTSEYTTINLVHFKDGKVVAGIVEKPRFQKYFTLRHPSGEEWICYNADIDTVTEMTLDAPVTFQEYRHYYPGVSSTLSMVVPGLGHVYNGDYIRAGVHVLILATAISAANLTVQNSDLDFGEFMLLYNGVLVIHLLDAADAWGRSVAHEDARKHWQHQRCSTRQYQTPPVTLGFGIAPLPNGAAAGVQVQF